MTNGFKYKVCLWRFFPYLGFPNHPHKGVWEIIVCRWWHETRTWGSPEFVYVNIQSNVTGNIHHFQANPRGRRDLILGRMVLKITAPVGPRFTIFCPNFTNSVVIIITPPAWRPITVYTSAEHGVHTQCSFKTLVVFWMEQNRWCGQTPWKRCDSG